MGFLWILKFAKIFQVDEFFFHSIKFIDELWLDDSLEMN